MQKTQYPGIQRLPDGRYRVEVSARCPKTGKRLRKRRTVAVRNPKEANEILVQWRAELESASHRKARVRLSNAAQHWLDGKLTTLKASTASHYGAVLANHVIPSLGDIFLDALDRRDIESWRDAQIGSVRAPTVNSRLRVLKTMLADECDALGLRNPAIRVRSVPRVGSGREKRRQVGDGFLKCEYNRLTPDEVSRVLTSIRTCTPQWHAFFATMALTGARFGELSALSWRHVDFSTHTIRVERSQWRGIYGSTKTSDVRVLPMEPELADVLLAHRQTLALQGPSDLLFPSRVGRAIPCASSLRKPLAAAYRHASIDRWVSPHGFRRSLNNATRQVASGIVVRALTGHVTEEMTEHYSTVEMQEKRDAVRNAYAGVLSQLNGEIKETSAFWQSLPEDPLTR